MKCLKLAAWEACALRSLVIGAHMDIGGSKAKILAVEPVVTTGQIRFITERGGAVKDHTTEVRIVIEE